MEEKHPHFDNSINPLVQILTKSNPISLRGTQPRDKKELYAQIRAGKRRILFVAPCAYGKGTMAASIIYDAVVLKQKRVLFVVPASSLVEQMIERFGAYGIEAGAIAGSKSESRHLNCQVATRQTLERGRDISWFPADIWLIDEAHEIVFSRWCLTHFPKLRSDGTAYKPRDLQIHLKHIGASLDLSFEEIKKRHRQAAIAHHPDNGGSEEAMKQINHSWRIIKEQKHLLKTQVKASPKPLMIGLTATPYRLSKRQSMGDIFESQVLGPTPKEMIQAGLLVPCLYFDIGEESTVDGIPLVNGDYEQTQLEVACSHPEAIKSAVLNYRRICPDRLAFCFAVGLSHASKLCEEFNNRNVGSVVIDARMSSRERNLYFRNLVDATDPLKILVSVATCYRGVDIPEVSCVIPARPTKSRAVADQSLGRGMRLAPWAGKIDCYVLDQAGIRKNFGFIEDLQYPELRGGIDTPRDIAPVKKCPACGVSLQSFAKVCPNCEYRFPEVKKLIPFGEMKLFVSPADEPLINLFRQKLKEAYERRLNPYWAHFEVKKRFNTERWCADIWGRGSVFDGNCSLEVINIYRLHLETKAQEAIEKDPDAKDRYDEKWVNRFMAVEFGSTPCA